MEQTILVVDDEEKNLKMLERMLLPERYRVLKSNNGKEALEILKNTKVQLVLLDIMMPGLSGFDVLKAIRENKELVAMPVIILTSLTGKDERIKGLQLGADDFITKPFDLDELRVKVNSQIKLSYFRKHLDEGTKFVKVKNISDVGIIVTDRHFAPLSINIKAKKLFEIQENPANILDYLKNKYNKDIRVSERRMNYILEQRSVNNVDMILLSLTIEQVNDPFETADSYMFIAREVE